MKVTMFKEQFVDMIREGRKTQTIRPIPKRVGDRPKVGEKRSLRRWTGKPYRSPQEEIKAVTVTEVGKVEIGASGFMMYTGISLVRSNKEFAQRDGFESADDLVEWFKINHGLPFHGMVIRWEP